MTAPQRQVNARKKCGEGIDSIIGKNVETCYSNYSQDLPY